MKICMVSRDFHPNIGGIAAHVYELSRALVQLGHDVCVVKADYGQPRIIREYLDGVHVHRLFVGNAGRGMRFLSLLFRTRRYIRELVRNEEFQLVHWHELESSSLETKMVLPVPLVFTNHSSRFLEMVEHPLQRRYLRWLIGHAHRFIAPSEELAAKTVVVGFPRELVAFIPNGVDAKRFHPSISRDTIRDELNIPSQTLLVLCPRRLQPKNGVIFFVRSLPLIRKRLGDQAVFVIAGGGYPEERRNIERQSRFDGTVDSLVLLDNVPYERMPMVFAASDLVVIPSLIEAVSIAGLEAMATGKPVIATQVGGLPYLVEDGRTGILVPPADHHSLASAMIRLLEDAPLRQRMGAAGRDRIEQQFLWDSIARRTLEVYESALRGFGTN